MSSVPSESPARRAVRRIASSPAVAGFRPAGCALAIAAAFGLQPVLVQAQPAGATVVHGQATLSGTGGNLLVTTRNGAGTSHSAINWQSFSVPGGTTTHFAQPSATSTSINRVIGKDPSAIFGTLSSNGRLVLVNPAGITVGAGAVVDTAAFTASTLGMSEADAIAARLLFGGAGAGLAVHGKVLARSGDVVLVGSRVETGREALVQANGATVLAAGEKVGITGRGLEGIRMEVQAGNEAVNLGALKGDAVGIFAGTLQHSGLVSAQAVSTEGGKVVLTASGGDALVSGAVTAQAGDQGGRIDVFGERVALLASTSLQANGRTGGGSIRVGGDYQGANPDAPNAKRTYVDATARIEANATESGNGGRVIVWSDELTRMHGQIAAGGGEAGGDGGFAEVSGKQVLEFTGRADLRAPHGRAGTLLLDPNDIVIEATGPTDTTRRNTVFDGGPALARIKASDLEAQLALSSVIVKTNGTTDTASGLITIADDVDLTWSTGNALGLQADGRIDFQGSINATGAGATLSLRAMNGGISQNSATSVIRVPYLQVQSDNGSVTLNGANQVGTVAGTAYGTGAAFELRNASTLTVGTASSPYGAAQSGVAADGNVFLGTSAGDLVVLANEYVESFGGSTTLSAAGDVDLRAGSMVQNWTARPISITAGGSILGAGGVWAEGSASSDGLAGAISLEAKTGSINIGSVHAGGTSSGGRHGGDVGLKAATDVTADGVSASGWDGGQGGDVFVTAGGKITVGWIDNAGGGSGTDLVAGGSAGMVNLTGGTGVQADSIDSWGGAYWGSVGAAPGGVGGMVNITASSGDVVLGHVDTSGGYGYGTSGGGAVSLTASKGRVDVGEIYTAGGDAAGSATAGAGGNVTIRAAGDVVLRPGTYSPFAIWADGGYSEYGLGGAGGRVDMVMGGLLLSIPSTSTEYLAAGTSTTFCSTCIVLANGGGGGYGTATSPNGQAGGAGGFIRLERTGGAALVLDTTIGLMAMGGEGGTAASTAGTGGTGGPGGQIELASAGPVVLRGAAILANGGPGGMNADGTPGGSAGALGHFTAYGTSVEVEADLDLNAKWTNNSVVNLRGASIVHGAGSFHNLGDLALHDTAALVPTAVDNAARLTSFGTANRAALTSNTGIVEVVTGAVLRAPSFTSNHGAVQANGTLEVGTTLSSLGTTDCSTCTVLAAGGDTLVNEAGGILGGNGNIVVSGGAGTVQNFGAIAPGVITSGTGEVGTLTLTANLLMESGSRIDGDLLNTSSHDGLKVSGTATTGGAYNVIYMPGASFTAGDVFDVLQAGTLNAATLPTVTVPELVAQAQGSTLALVAKTSYPFVAPPPPPPPLEEVQQVQSQVVTFANLFVEMAEQQQQEAQDRAIGRDDIVVTDTACTP